MKRRDVVTFDPDATLHAWRCHRCGAPAAAIGRKPKCPACGAGKRPPKSIGRLVVTKVDRRRRTITVSSG